MNSPKKYTITFNVSPEEWHTLQTHCQQNMQSKTEILRSLIRGLRIKIAKDK